MRHVGTVAIRISSIVLSVGLCIVLLEIGLAIAQVNTKSNSVFVPGVGSVHVPHSYYRYAKDDAKEDSPEVGYFNAHGFRDYERSYTKPRDTFRILVLGDSYAEALQVALEHSFPALLEKKFDENRASPKVEVLNLGQSGAGTADEYLRYLNYGVKYDPDMVMLAFLTGNDFRNNSKFLNVGEIGPYYTLDKDGNLVLDRTLLDDYEKSLTVSKRVFQFAKKHSYLANFISERLYALSFESRFQEAEQLSGSDNHHDKGYGSREVLSELSDSNIYNPAMSPRWREAVAITEALLRKFNDTARKNRHRFVLITLSNAEQLDPEAQAELRQRFGIPFDFDQPDRIIEEVAARERIPYLKLMPVFRDYHSRTGHILHGFQRREWGHWNDDGHQLAAETIYSFLKKNALLALAQE